MKKVWKFLSGKKTAIAAAFWTVIYPLTETGVITGDIETAAKIIATVLTVVGLGHKAVKK